MPSTFDPFRELDRVLSGALRASGSAALPMDLYRNGDVFVATLDLPGVDPASIDVDIEERTLTIRAERREGQAQDVQWLTRERVNGPFARQITLGYGVALDRIEAEYADGVLTLTIPVAEEAKPRKIQVSHSARSTVVAGETAVA